MNWIATGGSSDPQPLPPPPLADHRYGLAPACRCAPRGTDRAKAPAPPQTSIAASRRRSPIPARPRSRVMATPSSFGTRETGALKPQHSHTVNLRAHAKSVGSPQAAVPCRIRGSHRLPHPCQIRRLQRPTSCRIRWLQHPPTTCRIRRSAGALRGPGPINNVANRSQLPRACFGRAFHERHDPPRRRPSGRCHRSAVSSVPPRRVRSLLSSPAPRSRSMRSEGPRSPAPPVGIDLERCIYCQGTAIVRQGCRYKKHETFQLWYCRACRRTFTPRIAKGKTYPLKVILEALLLYYRGYTRAEVARQVKDRFGLSLPERTLSGWLAPRPDHLCAPARSARRSVRAAPRDPLGAPASPAGLSIRHPSRQARGHPRQRAAWPLRAGRKLARGHGA